MIERLLERLKALAAIDAIAGQEGPMVRYLCDALAGSSGVSLSPEAMRPDPWVPRLMPLGRRAP